jgi:CBS domain containing-hemolysin-like protein
LAGHIPRPGEVLVEDGLRFEILQSTERRVEKLRIKATEEREREELRA